MTATNVPTPRLPEIDLSDAALTRLTETLAATAERYDRSADFPWEPIQALHAAGVLRFGVPEEYGGQPVSVTDTVRLLQALGRGDPSVALIASMTVMTHASQHAHIWPDELYREVLAESLQRPLLFNHIRAEPELGAPARGGLPATRVVRTEKGWLLNGHKAYGTGAEGLAYHLVWAVLETDGEPLQGHAIVPGDDPGIEVVKTWDHLGMRASSTHDIVYRDIEVPFDRFQGEPFDPRSLTGGSSNRRSGVLPGLGLAITGLYVGVARAAQEFFVKFAHERVPSALGKPIATTERIQSVAGEIEAQLMQAEEIIYGLAARADAGDEEAIARAPFAKLLATRSAITAVQTAVAALGNPALTRTHPLERHLRDVLCARIHPPQDDVALITLGKRSLAAGERGTEAARG